MHDELEESGFDEQRSDKLSSNDGVLVVF